jgi:hypothetical protein
MPVKDLREWIEKVESMGKPLRIDGAHWDTEIGAITDLSNSVPALLLYYSIRYQAIQMGSGCSPTPVCL